MTAPTVQTTTETKPANKLRPGDKVFLYSTVPVTIIEATCLPAFQPAKTVKLTYRCENVERGELLATRTVPAGQTFPVYDDGEAF